MQHFPFIQSPTVDSISPFAVSHFFKSFCHGVSGINSIGKMPYWYIVDMQMRSRFIKMHYSVEYIIIRISFLKAFHILTQAGNCCFSIGRAYTCIIFCAYLHQIFISERINAFFDMQLKLMCCEAYFGYEVTTEHFSVQSSRTIIAADDYTFNAFRESDNSLLVLLAELGQIIHRNKWTRCECGFCHKLFLDVNGEVCCHSAECREAQKAQKEAIYKEHTEAYSQIKRTYDAFVRRHDSYLKAVNIDTRFPADYDTFYQMKEARKADMTALKKRLIRNGLPANELFNLGEQYKSEIRSFAENILEKYGYNPTEVAKIKNPKKNGKQL